MNEPRQRPGLSLVRSTGSASFSIGAVIVVALVGTALLTAVWTPHDATHVQVGAKLLGPNGTHLLGTDHLGRDILSSIMVGARTALLVGCLAVSLSLVCGVGVGLLSAFRGGWLDDVMMRLSDVLYAFPPVVLAIVIGATIGTGRTAAVAAIGIAYTPVVVRITRSAALPVLQREFVHAARNYGQSSLQTALKHVLPNILGYLAVQASVLFALAILIEAALSYLGLGTQPPEPSWGRSLQEAQVYLRTNPLLAVWPGVAIAISVLGFNLLGDGIRDRWEPQARSQR